MMPLRVNGIRGGIYAFADVDRAYSYRVLHNIMNTRFFCVSHV